MMHFVIEKFFVKKTTMPIDMVVLIIRMLFVKKEFENINHGRKYNYRPYKREGLDKYDEYCNGKVFYEKGYKV